MSNNQRPLDRPATPTFHLLDQLAQYLSESFADKPRRPLNRFTVPRTPAPRLVRPKAMSTLNRWSGQVYVESRALDPEEIRWVRRAIGVFARNYMGLYQSTAPDNDADRALDSGLRACAASWHLPRAMRRMQLTAVLPGLADEPDDRDPLLRAAAQARQDHRGRSMG